MSPRSDGARTWYLRRQDPPSPLLRSAAVSAVEAWARPGGPWHIERESYRSPCGRGAGVGRTKEQWRGPCVAGYDPFGGRFCTARPQRPTVR